MFSINKVTLIGNVGGEPEIRTMSNGARVAHLNIATTDVWRDKSTNERRERTEWHRVVIFSEGLISVIERFVKRGSKLYIQGQLETRKWSDNSGQERSTTEIVLRPFNSEFGLLDRPPSTSHDPSSLQDERYQNRNIDERKFLSSQDSPSDQSQRSNYSSLPDDLDDDIPF